MTNYDVYRQWEALNRWPQPEDDMGPDRSEDDE